MALAGLTGWLGYRAYQAREARAVAARLLVSVGRRGRDQPDLPSTSSTPTPTCSASSTRPPTRSTTNFAKRSQPFVDVVKQAKSKSVGTVNEAGLESVTGTEGNVLVAVTVKTENAGAQNQPPRNWRMRLTVKKTGADQAKVSKVEFVP